MGPANGGTLPASPLNTPTAITNQSAQGRNNVHVYPVDGANAACVKASLPIGQSCGTWSVSNNCNSFAIQVLKKCGGHFPTDIP